MFTCEICQQTFKQKGNHLWKHFPELKTDVIINAIIKGRLGNTPANKGKTWEESYGKEAAERRKKIHIINNSSKNFQSKESRIKTGLKLKGRTRPESVRIKVSNAHKGVPLSEEHKKQLSLHHWDNKGEKCHFYGKKGNLSSAWKGGVSFEEYPEEFNKQLKKQIKDRDNGCCVMCGTTDNEQRKENSQHRGLNIHHIDYNKRNCENNNLITLCFVCNAKANSNREYWQQYYSQKLDYRVVEGN